MKLFYLSAASLILISSTALVMGVNVKKQRESNQPIFRSTIDNSLLPILKTANYFPVLSAQGVIAVDLTSGVFLYEKNSDAKLLPASTTKIMTALVAMDSYSLDQVIKIGKIKVDGQKLGLYENEEMTVENLLYGLLVYSANDAAEVLAANFDGGRTGFVNAMNLKATELSMNNTHFNNPAGLDEVNHYSTAKDMTRLAQIAMKNSTFSQIVGTKDKTITDITGKSVYKFTNINKLLGTVDGVMGIKTGWTEGARENLVTYIKRGDKEVLIALLGSQDRFGETKELIDWIFTNFQWKTI